MTEMKAARLAMVSRFSVHATRRGTPTLIKTQRELPDLARWSRTMYQQAKSGTWNGQGRTRYFESCTHILRDLGLIVIFTRDTGYHTSGWWKNADYERCYHLSLSFRDIETGHPKPKDKVLSGLLVDAVFGRDKRVLWCEPPYSKDGKENDVWHYRLFCDEAWQPIKPRGEVHSTEFTEAGWKSFSDVQSAL